MIAWACAAVLFVEVEHETQLWWTAQQSRLQQFSSLPILSPAAAVSLFSEGNDKAE